MTRPDFGQGGVRRLPAPLSSTGRAPSASHYPSVRFIDCAQIEPEAWANGAGVTRTIANQLDADGNVDWRVSLATLDGSARFSQFPGVDRILVPVDNTSVELRAQDGHLVAHPIVPAHFPGDLPVWTTDIVRPTHVLNVMTRRAACRATVSVATYSRRVTPAPTHLLICAAGQWRFSSASLSTQTLLPMHGLWLDGRGEALDLQSDALDSRLISISIEPVER
ncbi:HutD family protein [Burkholderia sp. Ac-20345]|uniref:HutD/Ves family protein n=1 Tax=Burkholderia sp. Ac-20345 TaxID=2703891 RepID=UPI00197BC204|nr:HutD family protein [Burkholderia sp. Ac-20345]MBN3778638.1 HutD family protein [Burkholderia sp. Ac-20345]